jgi:hypothetical protein
LHSDTTFQFPSRSCACLVAFLFALSVSQRHAVLVLVLFLVPALEIEGAIMQCTHDV